MDKTCDNCFYEASPSHMEPCFKCDGAYSKWVAVDFLSGVDDGSTPVSEGAFVMNQMAEQLLQSKPQKPESALDKQVSGGHYKGLKIQPIEFLHANNIPFAEGCAIKYLCRWRDKGGIQDLEKAKHFIDLLIELETRM
jgi:hypothetical protein